MAKDEGRIKDEVAGADLGDRRLTRRLEILATTMARDPRLSFPEACGESDAELEATYRFLNNEAVEAADVLEPHYRATVGRMSAVENVLVVHDTTEFAFKGEREGLGRLQEFKQGFMGHFALAVSADGRRESMGIIGLLPIFRPWELVTEHWRKRYFSPDKESRRWGKLVDVVAARVGEAISPIHVMDQEADSYELLAHLVGNEHRFVIRGRTDRRKTTEGVQVAKVTEGTTAVATREIQVSERKARSKSKTRRLVFRPARQATLDIYSCVVEIAA